MEVARADIAGLVWLRVSRGYQLAVKLKAGSKVKFSGFREQVRPGIVTRCGTTTRSEAGGALLCGYQLAVKLKVGSKVLCGCIAQQLAVFASWRCLPAHIVYQLTLFTIRRWLLAGKPGSKVKFCSFREQFRTTYASSYYCSSSGA